MATMVTKPCKHKPLATVAHPNGSVLHSPSPPSEEIDGSVSTTIGGCLPINLADIYGLDGEWNLLSESNDEEYVSVLDVSDDEGTNFNSSNNNKVRSGNANIIVANGRQAQYNSNDHDLAYFPRNHRLTPMKSNNLGRNSVTSRPKATTVNGESLLNIPHCGKDFNKSLYPEIANVKIGATEYMSALGMRPLVCPFGYVEHSSGPQLSLSFVLSQSCLISTNFSWRSKTTQNCNEYLFQILKKNHLTFRLRFPYQGFYSLEVYAQRKSSSELPKNVFNYIIHAPDSLGESILPFPKAHKDWYVAGFVLKQPLDGILPSNSHSKFVVRVLRALSVFITSGGVSVDLKEHEGSWWIGLMKAGVAGSEISLYAVFTVKPRISVPLLSFRVVPTLNGKTTVEISAFENEIVAIERTRLEELLKSNREWLKKILEEEEKHSNDTVSAHKARLLKLSRKQSTKMGHTKHKHKLKPTPQKIHLRELLKNEQKILEKLRNDCQQRLVDIRKVESETIASVEAGGKKAIEEIRKSLNNFLHGLNIPQEKVTERLENHMQLIAELEAMQGELFSKNTWMEESLSEISNIHERMMTAVADLQRSTLASLGLVVEKSKDQSGEVSPELNEKEIMDQMENALQEGLNEITSDAKAYVDGTGEMKHESIKQIYSLQIKEMQLQDAWIKENELRIFELQQISSPASEIAIFLQTETEEAMNNCKKRLELLREEVFQQSQYLQDVYKERLSQFQKSEQEKLKEYETKLETTLVTACGPNKNLLEQLSLKPQEIMLHLESHLDALVQEIDVRDLSTFLAIRDAIANNVFEELEQAQLHMLRNISSVISIDTSGKQIVNTDIMHDLDPMYKESCRHAHRMLLSDFPTDTTQPTEQTPTPDSVLAAIQKTRKLPETQELLHVSSVEESECEEDVDEKSLHVDGTLTDGKRCSFLIIGKNEDCKDVVLKLVEESTDQLKQVSGSLNLADLQKQSVQLKDAQRLMTKAVLQIEDMLTIETKEILSYIIREVYASFQSTMTTVKENEEESLLQVRRVKRDSMFEVKDWLKKRFAMMAAYDAKTTAKLKHEVSSMIDEMEKLGNRRIMCIKDAFENNEAKIKAHYQELNKIKDKYPENGISGVQKEQFDESDVLDHIKNIYNETVTELESKVNRCYRSIEEGAISEFLKIEIQEQMKTNDFRACVLEKFWKNVQDGEKEVVNELQNYCNSREREEAEIARDCINGEEETMDLIRTDLIKKCNDIDRLESRNRTESKKLEGSRLEEIASLLKDNPWLWAEVKKEEEDRLLEKRIYDEERLFELEKKQEEAMASLRASREMMYSHIENKFREKHHRLRKEFLTQGADYVVDVFLTGKLRNIEEKILLEIENIHKEMEKHIKMNDHRVFREMEIDVYNTFERISTEYKNMYSSARELQEGVYEQFRALEEQIRTANRVTVSEDDVGDITKEMRDNLFRGLEVREKSHLREWLDTVSSNGLDDALKIEVISVEMILKSLDRIDELRNEAISLDIRKMLKVLTQFQSPHHTIQEALKGILLTLGDHEGFTSEWRNCMRRITPIGTTKLKWRVKKFILKELDPRIAKRTIDILHEVPFEKVDEISPELMTYCEWAWAVCEERLEMTLHSGHRTPEPANLNEEIQIFKRKYNSKGPVAGPRVLLFDTDETMDRHTDKMLESRKKKLFAYRDKQSEENDIRYYLDL